MTPEVSRVEKYQGKVPFSLESQGKRCQAHSPSASCLPRVTDASVHKITAVAGVLGSAPMSDCRPDSAPGARLEQRRGCGKGSGPGLWPPDPQKGTAPRAQDGLCQPGGTRGSRGKDPLLVPEGDWYEVKGRFPAGSREPCGTAGHPSPRDAGPLFPRARSHRGNSSQEKLALDGPSARGTSPAQGALGLGAAPAPGPMSPGGHIVPRAQ